MRLAYEAALFLGCNITSNFNTLLLCPKAKQWSVGIYHALLAAQNEPIILIPYRIFGDLFQTASGPHNSSVTFYDKLLNGYIDAGMTSLLQVETLANYRISSVIIQLIAIKYKTN